MIAYNKTMKNPHAIALGSIKSKKKAKASKLNGKKGGRPKVTIHCPIHGKTRCVKIPKGVMCYKCRKVFHSIDLT